MKLWRNSLNPDELIRGGNKPGSTFMCVGRELVYMIPIGIVVDSYNPKQCSFECGGLYQETEDAPFRCLFEPKDLVGSGAPNILVLEGDQPERCKLCLERETTEVTA